MFYAHFVLAKKGPLARVWMAAHWNKKLTKAHVFETSIEKSVEGILHPQVQMALRTTGHLLFGVVQIYSRKANYLLADCNEAFLKMKMAFRPGMVDLPEENREARANAITFAQVFSDFEDTGIAEFNEADIEAQFLMNQSRANEITMLEDYGSQSLAQLKDEGFGDLEFDECTPELLRDELHSGVLRVSRFDHPTIGVDQTKGHHTLMADNGLDEGPLMAGGLFEGELFVDENVMPAGQPERGFTPPVSAGDDPMHVDIADDDDFGGPPSVGGNSYSGGPPSPIPVIDEPVANAEVVNEENDENNPVAIFNEELAEPAVVASDDESFVLAPIDTSAIVRGVRGKRKRKLIVDQVKSIPVDEFKAQLADTEDIVTSLNIAPPTKRYMHWKETGGVQKLFALPGRTIPSKVIATNYQAHLTDRPSRPAENEDLRVVNDENADPLAGLQGPITPPSAAGVVRRMAGQKRKALEPLEVLRARRTLDFEGERDTGPPVTVQMSPTDQNQGNMIMGHDEDLVGPYNQPSLDPASLLGNDDDGYSANPVVPQVPYELNEEGYDLSEVAEEQAGDESDKQFEDRVQNKRAAQMYNIIKSKLEEESAVMFSSMCTPGSSRKQVARKFYSMLVLKKVQAVELSQDAAYEEILISKGPKFSTASF